MAKVDFCEWRSTFAAEVDFWGRACVHNKKINENQKFLWGHHTPPPQGLALFACLQGGWTPMTVRFAPCTPAQREVLCQHGGR